MRFEDSACPACFHSGLYIFHEQRSVPTNSCLLLASQRDARAHPVGDLRLGVCPACGFISNTRFDPSLTEYSSRYEETQSFSPHFEAFARTLAKEWVVKHDLQDKRVVEIGCGKGEFLVHMVEHGVGEGIGIDPGTHPERIDSQLADRLTWMTEMYGEHHASLAPDAIVCRHTLEHIGPVAAFLRMVRSSIPEGHQTKVLFELPDVRRVLDEVAFWDTYYEHCSYFSAGSLARLFTTSGFDVLAVDLAYDGQYLLLEALPAGVDPVGRSDFVIDEDISDLLRAADHFESGFESCVGHWTRRVEEASSGGGRTVVWGAGSKGVAFLNALPTAGKIDAAVDINPFKHGMYMAGTGHRIIGPDDLVAEPPELVIVMNRVYVDEIRALLADLGMHPEIDSL